MRQFVLATALLMLPFAAVSAQDADIKSTIAYVQSLQANTGGFIAQAPQPNIRLAPNLRSTSAAVRALYYLGGDVPNKDACKKFVDSCYDSASGGFANLPGGEPDVFTTAVGLMAVVRLDMPLDKYADRASDFLSKNSKGFEDIRIAAAGFENMKRQPPNARDWLELISKMRNPDGTYGKDATLARDSGGTAVTELRLGGKLSNRENVVKAIKDGQRPNGGYGKETNPFAADLETTYRVMRAFMMLKESPADAEGVRSFVLKCRNEDGGYGMTPGETSTVGATYFATIIRHWLKD